MDRNKLNDPNGSLPWIFVVEILRSCNNDKFLFQYNFKPWLWLNLISGKFSISIEMLLSRHSWTILCLIQRIWSLVDQKFLTLDACRLATDIDGQITFKVLLTSSLVSNLSLIHKESSKHLAIDIFAFGFITAHTSRTFVCLFVRCGRRRRLDGVYFLAFFTSIYSHITTSY